MPSPRFLLGLLFSQSWTATSRRSEAREQFCVARIGESVHRVMLGLVDDFARIGDLDLSRRSPSRAKADHPGLAEGAAQKALDEPLNPLLIAGLQAHALVDTGKQAAGSSVLAQGAE